MPFDHSNEPTVGRRCVPQGLVDKEYEEEPREKRRADHRGPTRYRSEDDFGLGIVGFEFHCVQIGPGFRKPQAEAHREKLSLKT